MRSGEHRAPLVPDDLLMVQEADPQQAIQDLAGERRGVPDIADFQTGNQRKCLRPVGARVAGDTGYPMPLGPLFQIAGLGSSAAVQPGPVPPLRIGWKATGPTSNSNTAQPLTPSVVTGGVVRKAYRLIARGHK